MPRLIPQQRAAAEGDTIAYDVGIDFESNTHEVSGTSGSPAGFALSGDLVLGFGVLSVVETNPSETQVNFPALPIELGPIRDGKQLVWAFDSSANQDRLGVASVGLGGDGVPYLVLWFHDQTPVAAEDAFDLTGIMRLRS